MKALAAILLCACSAPTNDARFYRARAVITTDDGAQTLQRGFGVKIVEERNGKGRTSEGHWLPLATLEAIEAQKSAPAKATSPSASPSPIEKWIDVDVAKQTLTAYEGDKPLRAFKVSTGAGADGAPYSTPKGTFHIYAKLRTATMASDVIAGQVDPHPYRFEGVPDVQYFNREIAFHGAYWHHRFGERISHGCVNLALDDARWLFDFTSPSLTPSEKERAVVPSGKLGTLVRVR